MMHLQRWSAPFRGSAVFLALLLGAVVLSGCSDDTSSTTPAPAPAPPTAPAPDPTLDAPGGLRVSATGSDFIEFSWNAVEGASNYEIQLSLTAGDFGSVTTATVSGTMHRFAVDASTTAHARVRAMASGVRSDWSDTVSGTTMAAPLMLAAPMPEVSGTGPDYIEWSWDAVENALAYEVQVAATEAGLSSAEMTRVARTTHRVAADPLQTRYIRVRAAAGTASSPVVSDWSGAVVGRSLAAPGVFTVRMTPPAASSDSACSGQVFCPDSGTDPKSAMASVNTRMTVTSSQTARITPVFLTGTPGAGIAAGDSSPFTYLVWSALQADIAGDGVTFRFDRVTTGAGQEPTPTGDTMYITCGPFRCSEASTETPAAPDITIADSAACNGFEADFRVTVGAVRNTALTLPMGVDLGWTYTATAAAKVTHVVAGAGNLKVDGGTVSRTSARRALGVQRTATAGPNFGGSVNAAWESLGNEGFGVQGLTRTTGGPIRNGEDDCFFATSAALGEHDGVGWRADAYVSDWGSYATFGNPGSSGSLRRPESCMRIITDDTTSCNDVGGDGCAGATRGNYLDGYSLEVKPQASVTWAGSRVNWPRGQDPFEDLDCAGVTVEASDQVDVCELFEEEVDRYWGRGRIADVSTDREWGVGSAEFRLRPMLLDHYGAHKNLVALQLARNKEYPGEPARPASPLDDDHLFRPAGSRFLSLWLSKPGRYQDSPDYAPTATPPRLRRGIDGTEQDRDLYYPSHVHAFQRWESIVPFGYSRSSHVAYYDVGRRGNIAGRLPGYPASPDLPPAEAAAQRGLITFALFDVDRNPIHGDFGKIDLNRDGTPDNSFSTAHKKCSAGDGGATGSSGQNTSCDAESVELEGEVTFVMNRDSMACAVTREVSITCDWDADADRNRYIDDIRQLNTEAQVRFFLSCEAS